MVTHPTKIPLSSGHSPDIKISLSSGHSSGIKISLSSVHSIGQRSHYHVVTEFGRFLKRMQKKKKPENLTWGPANLT